MKGKHFIEFLNSLDFFQLCYLAAFCIQEASRRPYNPPRAAIRAAEATK